jgi:hypothetical protein
MHNRVNASLPMRYCSGVWSEIFTLLGLCSGVWSEIFTPSRYHHAQNPKILASARCDLQNY